jgi:hypothetical protein
MLMPRGFLFPPRDSKQVHCSYLANAVAKYPRNSRKTSLLNVA